MVNHASHPLAFINTNTKYPNAKLETKTSKWSQFHAQTQAPATQLYHHHHQSHHGMTCSGMIQGRFRPVLAVLVRFSCFSHQSIRPDSAESARFSANQAKYARICEKKKQKQKQKQKKGLDAIPTCRQPRRTLRPASGHVELRCGTLIAASVLHIR